MIGQLSLGFKSFIDFVAENKNREKCKGKKWQTNRHQTKGFELIDCKLEVTVWARDDRHHFQAKMESFLVQAPSYELFIFKAESTRRKLLMKREHLQLFLFVIMKMLEKSINLWLSLSSLSLFTIQMRWKGSRNLKFNWYLCSCWTLHLSSASLTIKYRYQLSRIVICAIAWGVQPKWHFHSCALLIIPTPQSHAKNIVQQMLKPPIDFQWRAF